LASAIANGQNASIDREDSAANRSIPLIPFEMPGQNSDRQTLAQFVALVSAGISSCCREIIMLSRLSERKLNLELPAKLVSAIVLLEMHRQSPGEESVMDTQPEDLC
jgi:hypothetical protein